MALTSATAVLLGGASLTGGVIGVNPYWQGVATGAVLLIAVLLDRVHHAGLLGRRARTWAVVCPGAASAWFQ